MTFFYFPDTVNTYSMSSAGEFFFEENIYHAKCNTKSYNACAEGKDIGIVMLSGHSGHKLIAAKSASDSLILVADQADSDACAADSDTSVSLAGQNILCNLVACLNIRETLRCGYRTAVDNLEALGLKVLDNELSHVVTCVI